MNLGLNFLLLIIGIGIIGGLIFLIPSIAWRLIKKQPLFPKDEKLESPKKIYAGIALFGCFVIFSYFAGYPLFSIFFLLFMLFGIRALIVYKRNTKEKSDVD